MLSDPLLWEHLYVNTDGEHELTSPDLDCLRKVVASLHLYTRSYIWYAKRHGSALLGVVRHWYT